MYSVYILHIITILHSTTVHLGIFAIQLRAYLVRRHYTFRAASIVLPSFCFASRFFVRRSLPVTVQISRSWLPLEKCRGKNEEEKKLPSLFNRSRNLSPIQAKPFFFFFWLYSDKLVARHYRILKIAIFLRTLTFRFGFTREYTVIRTSQCWK